MSRQRRAARDNAAYQRAYDLIRSAPPDLANACIRAIDELAEIGTRLQIAPDQMLAALAVITGAALLCNVDARDEAEVNRRISFTLAALHIAVGAERIRSGAVGPRPDGSFGIKLDA